MCIAIVCECAVFVHRKHIKNKTKTNVKYVSVFVFDEFHLAVISVVILYFFSSLRSYYITSKQFESQHRAFLYIHQAKTKLYYIKKMCCLCVRCLRLAVVDFVWSAVINKLNVSVLESMRFAIDRFNIFPTMTWAATEYL